MDATLPFYDQRRRQFHLSRYRFAAERLSGLAVIDLACGTGYGSQILVEQGHVSSVVGVDRDPAAVSYAAPAHTIRGARFIASDGCRTGLAEGSSEAVVSFETIEHLSDDKAFVEEIHRILRPGGIIICSTPNQWDPSPHHERVYTLDSFCSLFDKLFTDFEVFNQNSGSKWKFNHGQPTGIVRTTPDNSHTAECYILVARRV